MKFDLDLFLLPNYCVLLFLNNMKYIYLSTMSTIDLVMKKMILYAHTYSCSLIGLIEWL